MATQRRGTITTWKDDRGFGFIRPDEGGEEVFFHVSGLSHNQDRPAEDIVVLYSVERDAKSRKLRAVNVQLMEQGGERRPRAAGEGGGATPTRLFAPMLGLSCAFFLVLALLVALGYLALAVVIIYMALSLITIVAYGVDKARSKERERQGARRTPEATLHLLELLGGWPGALVAQHYYPHKNQKRPYQAAFGLMVLLNLAALVLWLILGNRE